MRDEVTAMDEMVIRFTGGKRVDAEYAGHVIHTDQPTEKGCDGSAPDPFALFLAALGTCAGIYVLGFCQARGIPTEGIRLVQRHEFEPGSHKLVAVRLDVLLPVEFPEKYVAAVRHAAESCKVKKALANPPLVEVIASVRKDVAA
jgi:ribosomal protein S12 methylthiotransferase accessory factor